MNGLERVVLGGGDRHVEALADSDRTGRRVEVTTA